MKKLFNAIEGLFTATAMSGGDAADAVKYALKQINWDGELSAPEPMSQPVIDDQLQAACAETGQYGSNSYMIAEAVLEIKDKLQWHAVYEDMKNEPDMAAFTRNYAFTRLIGPGAPLSNDKVAGGLSLQGRDTYYPPHLHQAEESYWVVGGNGDWKVGIDPWFSVESGRSIYHETGVRHAMQTNYKPLLAIWLWTSHLDSIVDIYRG
jgi:mannose-6-phosphate isomerase-like protein (cupin superfamily)